MFAADSFAPESVSIAAPLWAIRDVPLSGSTIRPMFCTSAQLGLNRPQTRVAPMNSLKSATIAGFRLALVLTCRVPRAARLNVLALAGTTQRLGKLGEAAAGGSKCRLHFVPTSSRTCRTPIAPPANQPPRMQPRQLVLRRGVTVQDCCRGSGASRRCSRRRQRRDGRDGLPSA